MSDVQVSNARRVGFTATALVAFWVASIGAYSLGCEPEGWPCLGSRSWLWLERRDEIRAGPVPNLLLLLRR
jgi:hypothetical protein